MDWRGRRQSSNIEDRRGQPLRAGGGGLLLLLLRILPWLLRTRAGRVVLAVGVVGFFGARMLGIDLLQLTGPTPSQTASLSAEEQQLAEFVSVVLADTEQTWQRVFTEYGERYEEPVLVLFSQRVASACGSASAAVGPFYCPADRKVYLDLSFFQDLERQLGAPGDFAQAYVVAHEVGHHIQTLLGISQEVRATSRGKSAAVVNALSVRQELQADCLAGVWGHAAHNYSQLLEPGDLEEALQAAAAIGDDRLQKRSGGEVVPDSFTHGTSAQRVAWFKRGFESGDMGQCDTFSAQL
ncbi:zinc metallopeptidase [Pseudomonas saudimassiliensis]|uniref:Zinc metallopeptidase n=1 Tax=Pseudomonas saudimassiliensis TaxID=1461581 RepID=A0A078MHA7_9PSED|nr:neutral zinc metallopeptidase [Pseudomonas saudimassiliensis]CEA06733.1 zinc metallopeptidase [Pseudomonas saudimassiliensis]CEF28064.1 zinc metallopeptidase [Pseudomonas saudimassiliensis]